MCVARSRSGRPEIQLRCCSGRLPLQGECACGGVPSVVCRGAQCSADDGDRREVRDFS